jgi:deoxyribonuclease-4
MRPFGYHIAGGQILGKSLESAAAAGFTAAQIFLGPPQQVRTSPISDSELTLFLRVKKETGMKVFAHAPYVIHAFARPENKEKNDLAVKRFIRHCDMLELDGFVLHMGGTKWYDVDQEGTAWGAARELFSALKDTRTQVLLENCASGNDLSGNLKVICELLGQLREKDYNVGLCLDTCHAWAWGYNLNDYDQLKALSEVIRPYLQLIHLNSAPEKVTCGGKYDRHASIKSGVIEPASFSTLLTWYKECPTIVERDTYTDVVADSDFVRALDIQTTVS